MRILDAILFAVLLLGNILGLPIWCRLFGAPVQFVVKTLLRLVPRIDNPPPTLYELPEKGHDNARPAGS